MRQKIYVLERPSVCPDCESVQSKLSNAPRAVLYISGKATMAAARIPPYHVITNLMPSCIRRMPIGRFVPKMSSRK